MFDEGPELRPLRLNILAINIFHFLSAVFWLRIWYYLISGCQEANSTLVRQHRVRLYICSFFCIWNFVVVSCNGNSMLNRSYDSYPLAHFSPCPPPYVIFDYPLWFRHCVVQVRLQERERTHRRLNKRVLIYRFGFTMRFSFERVSLHSEWWVHKTPCA